MFGALVVLAVPAAYLQALALGLVWGLSQGMWVTEMDWDGDGHVSSREILQSLDLGRRRQGDCVEYFWLKDGLPFQCRCSGRRTDC